MEKPEFRGQYSITLDDKSRIMLPAKIRSSLSGDVLILTKGVDNCLNLYIPDDWEPIRALILANTSEFSKYGRALRRRMIDPAEEVAIDSVGRIKIPLPVMRNVGIRRSVSCFLLGRGSHIEIWDMDAFDRYEEESASGVQKNWEEIGELMEGE